MGSPVSVMVANLVMEEVEQMALSSYPSPPRFWKRYVDDTCTVLPKGSVSDFHQHLNGMNKHIQFTVEEETDGNLPFLDVLLIHNKDGSIDTSVYRKKTHTDRYLDFSSHHPLVHKKSVVSTLLKRTKDLSSVARCQMEEETHVRQTLKGNGYPKRFVNRTATYITSKHQKNSNEVDKEQKYTATVTLPYIQGVTESIKRMLEGVDVRVRMKPHRTLRQILVNPKDPIPIQHKVGIVYRVPCKDCPKVYVGQSGRTLECRIKEHKRAVERGNTEMSAIAEHAWRNDHRVDWEAVDVLDVNTEWYKRCVIESWHIQHEKETLNRDLGLLSQIYNTLQ